jgi:hypothetical protein
MRREKSTGEVIWLKRRQKGIGMPALYLSPENARIELIAWQPLKHYRLRARP